MSSTSIIGKSKQKTLFRKVAEWLHLWLGLVSGIVVLIVCITGALWVFRYEVYYFTDSYQRVEVQPQAFLPPSTLISKAKGYLINRGDTGVVLNSVNYTSGGRAVSLAFRIGKSGGTEIYMNPYNAQILKDKREESGADKFFMFVRAGHRFLWLPQKIGSPVVGSFCIVFLVMIITGLIWWYPRKWSKKMRDNSFKVKWSAKWKRLNIDLHNVVGFYTAIFIFLLTLTGIAFTFEWFHNGLYTGLTWHAPAPDLDRDPVSDTSGTSKITTTAALDYIWKKTNKSHPDFGRVILVLPDKPKDTYQSMVFFGDGTLIYNQAHDFYDRNTLKPVAPIEDEDKPYKGRSTGDKIYRMNFDIHTGQILGLPTKIIAFLACLVGASLPVTGFLIWYNRKWGKKRYSKISPSNYQN